jgi:hypothetical protein
MDAMRQFEIPRSLRAALVASANHAHTADAPSGSVHVGLFPAVVDAVCETYAHDVLPWDRARRAAVPRPDHDHDHMHMHAAGGVAICMARATSAAEAIVVASNSQGAPEHALQLPAAAAEMASYRARVRAAAATDRDIDA